DGALALADAALLTGGGVQSAATAERARPQGDRVCDLPEDLPVGHDGTYLPSGSCGPAGSRPWKDTRRGFCMSPLATVISALTLTRRSIACVAVVGNTSMCHAALHDNNANAAARAETAQE